MTGTRHQPTTAPETPAPGPVLDVVVAVGTDTHPFDRLMTWLEGWYATRAHPPRVLLQHGRSRPPAIPGATAFLEHQALVAAMAGASVVVTHGGPASIAEARRHGHRPIVVARDPAYGEHVDDHQMLFTTRMAAAGLIRRCTTAAELADALDSALAEPPARRSTAGPSASRAAAIVEVGRIVDGLIAGGRTR